MYSFTVLAGLVSSGMAVGHPSGAHALLPSLLVLHEASAALTVMLKEKSALIFGKPTIQRSGLRAW